jgi:uncharacterized repeat protein (TIGR03803 family)
MKTSGLSRYALFACCVAIAACSQATELSHFQYTPNVGGVPERLESPVAYSVLYSFHAPPDGIDPWAGLIDVNGTLYGTTEDGGPYGGAFGDGTVFSITTGGTEQVLHSFGEGTDGIGPIADLIAIKDTLYGTTFYAGAYGYGTVFSITTGGTEKVLHSFADGIDGAYPRACLIDVSGTLYGTTEDGGAYGHGTVFSITTGGTEKVLYSFRGRPDGASPYAGLIDVSGTLYGTTAGDGGHGHGTVFSITTGGREKVLYSFRGRPDGASPLAGLIDVSGALYGTTSQGGKYRCGRYGFTCGTVFRITPGTEKVLHSFGKGTDGTDPYAGLINVSGTGTLYGTTSHGGAYGTAFGDGTVYSITTGGTEKVLHSFANGTDGALPLAGLIDVSGTLYGTTLYGGYDSGTVYSITP